MLEAVTDGDRLLAWAVATDDIEDVAQRLHLVVAPGSRTKPDGETLVWRLTGMERSMLEGAFPFFSQWDCPAELHPATGKVAHRVTPRGIAWVEIAGDEQALRAWLDDGDIPDGCERAASRC